MRYRIMAMGGILATVACGELATSDADIIRVAERENLKLVCRTNEPFLTIAFNANQNGDGRITYRYPDNTPPDFEGEADLTRTAGSTPNADDTDFRLSNGMEGTITRTPGGLCMDDMAGTPHDYKLTITRWGEGNAGYTPKYGCCDLVR